MYRQFLKYFFQITLMAVVIIGCKKTVEEDTTAPVLTLNGSADTTIVRGTAYSDPGATATDETDGNITVQISGTVNSSAAGVYTLSYSATDKAGNKSIKERTVNVSYAASELTLSYDVTDSSTTMGIDTVKLYVLGCTSSSTFQLKMLNLFNSGDTVSASIVGATLSITSQQWTFGTPLKVSGSGTISLSGSEITLKISYSISDTIALTSTVCKAVCVSQ